MIKFILAAVLGSSVATPSFAFNYRPAVRSLKQDLATGNKYKLAGRGDAALAAMIRVAEREMLDRGYKEEAEFLVNDFESFADGYLTKSLTLEGLGDHAAYSQWLAETYLFLESVLGDTVMRLTHLDDINIFNYAIVVVFHMDKLGSDPIGQMEYELHFDPFCGVLAYWGTWIVCEVATSGTGWILVCTPAGMLAESVTYNLIAPNFSQRFYERMYP